MTARVLSGPRHWEGERDNEGYRSYKIIHLVECDPLDCPYTIMNASGLPQAGSVWSFGNTQDPWAFCYPDMRVTIHDEKEGEPVVIYAVEQIFSTRPINRCTDNSNDNPLLEPDQISGSFVKYTKEAVRDRAGRLIASSSHERFRGPQVEFDHNRPTVRIQQNVPSLGLSTFAEMVDTTNDAPLWGLQPRCIKLSNVSWSRERYGSCQTYYTRTFEFDINFDTFDRYILDEGTKWCGGNEGDPANPKDFVIYTDENDNPARVILDGNGFPLDSTNPDDLIYRHVIYYRESNFLTLGIPAFLG